MSRKERAMIELTETQAKALDGEPQPIVVVDPRTGQQYRLIREEVFKVMQGIIAPFNRGWDPDDDLILRKGAEEPR
jgi:hypothetical protein